MDRSLDPLLEFLAIPSVSTLPEHREDVARAARWVGARLEQLGFAVELIPTAGHPVVLGELEEDPRLPHVLFYAHYDVQPADPLPEWETPPFAPTVRQGYVYARGASDDKGPLMAHLEALAALRREGVPVNVIALIEGEEEVSSPHLPAVVEANLVRLGKASVALVSDTTMFGPDQPAVCLGLRGLADLEITVTGPRHDLHSGLFGGAIQNPAHALARILASFHDERGRVRVEGFYDDVTPPGRWEAENARRLPFDEAAFLAATGSPALFGEEGYTTLERLWFRPTLEVNGLIGGFTGPGQKTIVPAKASAKITCRLVPDQVPARILEAIRRHVEAHTPPGVRVQVEARGGAPAVVVPPDLEPLRLVAKALRIAFEREPVFTRMGGSIPIVSLFQELLGIPTLLVGFSLPDDGFHSPNERFSLENYRRGQETVRLFYRALAGLDPQEAR